MSAEDPETPEEFAAFIADIRTDLKETMRIVGLPAITPAWAAVDVLELYLLDCQRPREDQGVKTQSGVVATELHKVKDCLEATIGKGPGAN